MSTERWTLRWKTLIRNIALGNFEAIYQRSKKKGDRIKRECTLCANELESPAKEACPTSPFRPSSDNLLATATNVHETNKPRKYVRRVRSSRHCPVSLLRWTVCHQPALRPGGNRCPCSIYFQMSILLTYNNLSAANHWKFTERLPSGLCAVRTYSV